jgi:hypothetical protein
VTYFRPPKPRKKYTYSGIACMVRPDVKKVSLNHTTGKGATDTCRAKVPQWYIQRLLEHESMTATKI